MSPLVICILGLAAILGCVSGVSADMGFTHTAEATGGIALAFIVLAAWIGLDG